MATRSLANRNNFVQWWEPDTDLLLSELQANGLPGTKSEYNYLDIPVALDSALEFDTANGDLNSCVKISDTLFMNVWNTVPDFGQAGLFSVSASGVIAVVGSISGFNPGTTASLSLIKIVDGFAAVFYSDGTNIKGRIITYSDAGGVLSYGTVQTLYTGTSTDYVSAVKIDDTHAWLFWSGSDEDGFTRIFSMNTGTDAITGLDSVLEFNTTEATLNSAVLLDYKHAVNIWKRTSDGLIQMFSRDDSYVITASSAAQEFDGGGNFELGKIIKVNETKLACFWQGTGNDGFAELFSYSVVDGTIDISFGTQLEFDINQGGENSPVLLDGNHIINFWEGVDSDAFTAVFEIDGANLIQLGRTLEYDTNNFWNSAILLNTTQVVNCYQGVGGDGFARAFNIRSARKNFTSLYSNIENPSVLWVQGERFNWYANLDNLATNGNFASWSCLIINTDDFTEVGAFTVTKDVVSGASFRFYAESSIPSFLTAGNCYRMLIVDTTDNKVLYISNEFLAADYINERTTKQIEYRNGKDILNFDYETLTTFKNKFRVKLVIRQPLPQTVSDGYVLVSGAFQEVETTSGQTEEFISEWYNKEDHEAFNAFTIHNIITAKVDGINVSYLRSEGEYAPDWQGNYPLSEGIIRMQRTALYKSSKAI